MQLLISSPWWFLLLCLLTGFAYSYLLYKPQFQQLYYRVMAILRFISISLLCFFLLGPVLIQFISTIEKPKIILVLDNSESITGGKDAEYYKKDFLAQWYKIRSVLGEDYQVDYLNVSGDIKPEDSAHFDQKRTNLSRVFDYVNNTYSKQNIGAVLLASDGIYNRGSNPVYKTLNGHALMYTIGMGDSSLKKDAIVKEVSINAIAYLNNEFPLGINISAFACKGNQSVLTVSSEGKILYSETILFSNNEYFKNIPVNIEADKPGTKHLVVALSPVNGEHSQVNNRKDVFIDIIDGREKILMVFNGPHPDIGAIKEAINSNKNYEVVSLPYAQVKLSELNLYSMAILHQLPSRSSNSKDLISGLRNLKIPIWCIVGNQTAIEQLSLVSPNARIERNQGRFNESQAYFNESFNAFTLEENTRRTIAGLPPLKSPYGVYSGSDHMEVMAFQKIGVVNTKIPGWGFSNQDGEKTAFLFGEGFWRWQLMDYVLNESHNASNELVSKTIQYLAVKEDKRKFRVYPTKNVLEEDEPVKFIAELYNASYELVNDREVTLSLINSDKKVFNYTFSKSGNSYQLDLGLLVPGAYTYSAATEGMKEKLNGKILVTPLQTELVNTRADFALLNTISNKHKGMFYDARHLAQAIDAIKKNTTISTVSYNEKKLDELINLKWLFFLLLSLLTAEWFIRKYEGGY